MPSLELGVSVGEVSVTTEGVSVDVTKAHDFGIVSINGKRP